MPVGIRASLTPILALSLIAASLEPLEAQAAQRTTPPEMSSDSTAWQRVLVYVVGALGTQIVQAAADTSPQPWRLRLPTDEPQRRLLEMQLKTIHRARPVTDSDAVTYTLEIGPISIRNDTARVRVSVVVTRRCPGSTQTTGSGNVDDVFIPRAAQGFWGAARSSRAVHGDRVGCMRFGP